MNEDLDKTELRKLVWDPRDPTPGIVVGGPPSDLTTWLDDPSLADTTPMEVGPDGMDGMEPEPTVIFRTHGEPSPGEGAKHDGGKLPWHLLPIGPVTEIVAVLRFGASKYGPDNWQGVLCARERYYSATLRHITRWWTGEVFDPESGLPHLAHAACSLLFLMWFDIQAGQGRDPAP